MKTKSKIYSLFITFLKIGAFTFGGGYAMIPLIQREIVEKKKWINNNDILEIVAIAESTPGPIAINAATFVGYQVAGFWGALLSTIGVVIPSFIIIILISLILNQFEDIELVKYALFGIRIGVLALIIKALSSMYKQCPKNIFAYIVMALSLILVSFFNVNVLLIIIGCAIFGLIQTMVCERK